MIRIACLCSPLCFYSPLRVHSRGFEERACWELHRRANKLRPKGVAQQRVQQLSSRESGYHL